MFCSTSIHIIKKNSITSKSMSKVLLNILHFATETPRNNLPFNEELKSDRVKLMIANLNTPRKR